MSAALTDKLLGRIGAAKLRVPPPGFPALPDLPAARYVDPGFLALERACLWSGAWLYAGGPQAVLHMYFERPVPPGRAGVIDHMAFTAKDLKAVKARFDASGTKYDLRQQAGAGTWQLFCHDPTGAKVELDFDASETL